VTEHVREKFSCRSCEMITQPPASFHAIARGFAGPSLLAMILVEKYANHQPLNRQSELYAREGIELSVSTMADHVGACAAELMPLYELIRTHVLAAERIHGDDTTVPVFAKVTTRTGRLWTYVRDDQPFGAAAAPAAVYFYSPIAAANIPSGISPDMPGFCKPTRMIQHGLQAGAKAGSDHRSGVLGARKTQVLQACRHRLDGAEQDEACDLADRFRSRPEDRRDLCAGTLDQWIVAPGTPCRAQPGHLRWSTISSTG